MVYLISKSIILKPSIKLIKSDHFRSLLELQKEFALVSNEEYVVFAAAAGIFPKLL